MVMTAQEEEIERGELRSQRDIGETEDDTLKGKEIREMRN